MLAGSEGKKYLSSHSNINLVYWFSIFFRVSVQIRQGQFNYRPRTRTEYYQSWQYECKIAVDRYQRWKAGRDAVSLQTLSCKGMETWVQSLGWEDPLEKGKATHSSILAWRIPWTVQFMGLQRVGHDSRTFTSHKQPSRSSSSSLRFPNTPRTRGRLPAQRCQPQPASTPFSEAWIPVPTPPPLLFLSPALLLGAAPCS